MPEICGDMMGNRPGGSHCFLLAGDTARNVPIAPPPPLIWACPKVYS